MVHLKSLLTKTMEKSTALLKCEKIVLFLYDDKTKELWTPVIQYETISEIRIPRNLGLVGSSFNDQKAINIKDSFHDPRFKREIDQLTGHTTHSALYIPIPTQKGKILGVIQLINSKENGFFTEHDEEKLSKFSRDIANTIEESKRNSFVLFPGLSLVIATTIAGFFLHNLMPTLYQQKVSNVLFVIILGILINNLFYLPVITLPGIRFATRQVLRAGIVLMGAKLMLFDIVSIGPKIILMIVLLIIVAFSVSQLFAKLCKVPKRLATLLAAGASICGGSAIASMVPVVKAKEEQFTLAIAINTLIGTILVFILPLLGQSMGFSGDLFGTWAGMAINDTAQVIAAGAAFSEEAEKMATTVKLIRNAMLIIVIVVVGAVCAKANRGAHKGNDFSVFSLIRQSFPAFLIGFFFLALSNTLGVFTWIENIISIKVQQNLTHASHYLILFSLAGVGLSTNLTKLKKVGLLPAVVGLVVSLSTVVLSFLLITKVGM